MAEIPTIEPTQFRAGDTVKWEKSLADYLASAGWTLKYRLINSAGKYDITAAADGDDHAVTVTAATSAAYTAGTYQWQAYVETGSGASREQYTIGTGTVEILPNLAGLSAAYDTRSHVKKVLDALRAALEGRASRTDLNYTVAGRTLQSMTHAELISAVAKYESLYKTELAAESINKGLGSGRRVVTRFRS